MKKFLTSIGIAALLCPNITFSQTAPNLGSAANFVLFTGTGQFTSTSSNTIVTGDVGNVTGAFSAFPPGLLTGNKHQGDAVAIQAANDIDAAYAEVLAKSCDFAHSTAFGGGEILAPGVHCAGAASTFSGNLTLDAGGNSSAIFIIKINGAFASVNGSEVILANGALACNVYWQVNGQLDLLGTIFKGTMLVDGAVNLKIGTNIEGRILDKTGAFIFEEINATICNLSALPLKLINFNVARATDNNVQLNWTTTAEINISHFELESSTDGINFRKTGSVVAKGNNYSTAYAYKDVITDKTGTQFYRLKMVNKDATFSLSPVKSVKLSEIKTGLINISPNPAVNYITITVNAEDQETVTLTIINMHGQKIRQKNLKLSQGINFITEDINSLSKEGYILSIKNNNTGKVTRMSFQKL